LLSTLLAKVKVYGCLENSFDCDVGKLRHSGCINYLESTRDPNYY